MKEEALRKLPSVDALIRLKKAELLSETYSRSLIVSAVRDVLEEIRSEILSSEPGSFESKSLSPEAIIDRAEAYLIKKFSPSLHRVINATGVILHTGLGRALLSQESRDSIAKVMEGYCNLAVNMETGRRGHRDIHLESLICELTGAEAATVVNNNAAATMLILNTVARGKEVIVSRGQLVEIGGSFRMPEVMEASGAVLREVGTTNKTHLRDYVSAINENTGAVMRVHHSNYRILGFAGEPLIEELVEVAAEYNLPLVDDLGSGALVDLKEFGLETEPLVQHSIEAGVDVACFSGDKLIGGPQCGIIVGKASLVDKIKKNPLSRALRVGKLTIAGLEATLRLFLNRENLIQNHPLYRMFSLTPQKLDRRAKKVMRGLRTQAVGRAEVSVVAGDSQVGSGSVPVETLPTRLLSLKPSAFSAEELARRLRNSSPPIMSRVHKEALLFDFRTIQPEEDRLVLEGILKVLQE